MLSISSLLFFCTGVDAKDDFQQEFENAEPKTINMQKNLNYLCYMKMV